MALVLNAVAADVAARAQSGDGVEQTVGVLSSEQ